MAIAEPMPSVPLPPGPSVWRGRAFGIDLHAATRVPGLQQVPEGAAPAAHRVSWELTSTRGVDAAWGPEPDETQALVDLRHADGRLFLSVEHAPDFGYRVWAPGHGRHVVSPRGDRILSAIPGTAPSRWQRLFYAQPLPLAASLQGIDLLHASAVVVDGSAIACIAPSGTGKSSTAAHLVALGATFLTDDVLALELMDGSLLAHPGPARMAIDRAELASMPTGRPRLGPTVGRTDKAHVEPVPSARPLPLSVLYFLRRTDERPTLTITRHKGAPTRALLGSGFLTYHRDSARLVAHLEVCARVAAEVRTYEVAIPRETSARDVALGLLEHVKDGM